MVNGNHHAERQTPSRSTEDNGAKTFVVIGVTSGIGLALARALAHVARRLVIVGRTDARLRAATELTVNENRNLEIIPILADAGPTAQLWPLSGTLLRQFPPSSGCKHLTPF